MKHEFLVIGADGLIGSNLITCFEQKSYSVLGTSRNKTLINKKTAFLDLADEKYQKIIDKGYFCAIFCIGMTNIALCETKPQCTYHVNVTKTLALIQAFHAAGTRVVFLSSNAVFNGMLEKPKEDAPYCPITEYGHQKMEVEQKLLALPVKNAPLTIIRLTKVLSRHAGIGQKILHQLRAEKSLRVFDDLMISPISLEYAVNSIITISNSKHSGIFHLSGCDEISYVNLARSMAITISRNSNLIQAESSCKAGAKILFRPAHPALGMKRTHDLLGLTPEPTEHLLTYLTEKSG
ncbi:MAG: sugar nucleotide-binding protein [Mariprofundales bacterium]